MTLRAEPKIRIVVAGLILYSVLSLISMATMSIGAALLVASLIYFYGCPLKWIRELAHRVRGHRIARQFAWVSVFFSAACVLSLIVARLWPLSFGGHFSEAHPLRDSAKVWYFAWPFVLWHALEISGPAGRRLVLRAWLGTFVALSVLAVVQHYIGWPRPLQIPTDLQHFHATLFLGHHLSVASILIFPFFAWLDLPGIPLVARGLVGVLGFVGLMFTYSRTLWIALPAGLLLWALLKLGRRQKIAAVVLLVLAFAGAYQVPTIRGRFHDLGGVYHRQDLWEANWRFFEDRPLTGVGLKHNEELSGFYLMEKLHTTDVFQGHAHNNFLDILSSTGAIGAIGFLAWWGFLIWILVAEVRGTRASGGADGFFGTGLLAAFFVYQLNGLTQVNFWEAKVQHQLMWMVAWVLLWSRPGSEPCSES